jgi:hypothetical protein
MPIGAGFVVAYLQKWGFSPALKFLTRAIEGVVDDSKNAAYPTSYWQVSCGRVRMLTAQFPACIAMQQLSSCQLPHVQQARGLRCGHHFDSATCLTCL